MGYREVLKKPAKSCQNSQSKERFEIRASGMRNRNANQKSMTVAELLYFRFIIHRYDNSLS